MLPGQPVRHQLRVGVGRQLRRRHPVALGIHRQEVLQEYWDVFAAIAQRRRQVDHLDAVIQILAELLRGNAVEQVAVGRGDHAHVHPRLRAIGADALQLPVFEKAQQQRLHPQAHLADLVEEDRAAVRHVEQATPIIEGPGEAALDVPEQRRLQQLVGNGRAVDGDERGVGAAAATMNQSRDHLFADAALSGDQHLRVGARGIADLGLDGANRRPDADQLVGGRSGAAHVGVQILRGSVPWR